MTQGTDVLRIHPEHAHYHHTPFNPRTECPDKPDLDSEVCMSCLDHVLKFLLCFLYSAAVSAENTHFTPQNFVIGNFPENWRALKQKIEATYSSPDFYRRSNLV